MKNVEFYSREELLTMPLVAIRGLDIETPEQQVLVQDVVNIKLASLPAQRPIYRNDVPDIKTPEEEMKWQEIMDKRTRLAKGLSLEELPSSEPILEPVGDPIAEPVSEPAAPAAPAENPVAAPDFNPEAQPLAQPTEEGEPVNFSGEVNSALQSKKPGRPAKTKK